MKVKNAFITKAVEDSADGDGVKNLKLQRVINGCVAYCVFSIIALVSFYYGNVVSYSYIYSVGIRQVRAEIEFADEQSDIPISVAMGYVWTDAEEKNLPELIHCADEKMYKDKKRIKENTPSA